MAVEKGAHHNDEIQWCTASKPFDPSDTMQRKPGNRVNMCVVNISQFSAVSEGNTA